jgi:beta propeller repeat protein
MQAIRRKRQIAAALACAFAIFCATPASARFAGTTRALSTGSSIATQTAPAISGTRVVWTDRSVISSGGFNSDIFYVDTATLIAARNLTSTPGEQEYLEDIDATNLVYTHSGPGMPGDILLYDVTTSIGQTIAASDAQVTYSLPAISGRFVVYVRTINTGTGAQVDIDGYDIAIGAPIGPITGDAAVQSHPRVSGDVVVYEDYGAGNADIYAWRPSNGGRMVIASGPSQQRTPDVSGNWVVWVDTANGTDQIIAWNMVTGGLVNVTSVASNKLQPRVSGNRVVWADDRAGNFDIRGYDFATGIEDVLVDGPGDQVLSDIDGHRVVYSSNENGYEQIYLFEFAGPPPSPLPLGCDPALTDIVVGPVAIAKPAKKTLVQEGTFSPDPGRTYYMCVENGRPNGTLRASNVVAAADGSVVLTPTDFRPATDPPRWVAGLIRVDEGWVDRTMGPMHTWQIGFLGLEPVSANVTIRVVK